MAGEFLEDLGIQHVGKHFLFRRLAMQKADHVGGRLLEVDGGQARPGAAADGLLPVKHAADHSLGESARAAAPCGR